jgi:hypothetical protein
LLELKVGAIMGLDAIAVVVSTPFSVAVTEKDEVSLSELTDVNKISVLVRLTVAVPTKSLMWSSITASIIDELFAP